MRESCERCNRGARAHEAASRPPATHKALGDGSGRTCDIMDGAAGSGAAAGGAASFFARDSRLPITRGAPSLGGAAGAPHSLRRPKSDRRAPHAAHTDAGQDPAGPCRLGDPAVWTRSSAAARPWSVWRASPLALPGNSRSACARAARGAIATHGHRPELALACATSDVALPQGSEEV